MSEDDNSRTGPQDIAPGTWHDGSAPIRDQGDDNPAFNEWEKARAEAPQKKKT